MNPKNHQHPATQPPNDKEPVSAHEPPSLPSHNGWSAWLIGALAIGAGAMSGNSCNLNTGTQLIQRA